MSLKLFDRIRNKAQQAVQSVGNFIDRDKSIGGVQLAQGGLGNRVSNFFQDSRQRAVDRNRGISQSVNNYFQPSPQGVRPRDVIREVPKTIVDIPRGFVGEMRGGNPEMGFLGFGQPTDPTQPLSIRNPAPPYVPQTAGEKFGSFGAKFGLGTITGQNTGINQAANEGLNSLLSLPSVSSTRTVLGNQIIDKADETMASINQRLNPLDISYEDLRAVTTNRATPDQLERYKQFNALRNKGQDVNQILQDANRQPGRVANFLDDLLSRGKDLFTPKQPTPISGLLPSQAGQTTTQPAAQISSILQPATSPASNASAMITQPSRSLDSVINPTGAGLTQAPAPELSELDEIIGFGEAPPEKYVDRVLSSRPEKITPPATTAPTGKSGLRRTYEAVAIPNKTVISKSGPAGKKIVDILNTTDEQVDLASGEQVSQMKSAIDNLNKEEKITFADAVEGKIDPISDKQEQAIQTWNDLSRDIYQRAQEVGLDIGFIERYFPRHVITDKAGRAKGSLGRGGERRYGNLELARQTDAPYDKDPSVLFDYIKKANQRIIEARNFGKADENLYNLASETTDPAQTTQYLDQILRKNQEGGIDDITQALTSYNTISKLKPTTSLLNLTQNLSTTLRTDPGVMLKTTARILTNPKEAVHNAIKSGELEARSERVLQDFAGKGDLAGKWIRFIGMEGTENFNRIVATNAGIDYFKKLNKRALNGNKAALREIKRLGMEVNDNPIKAGRKISQETQFATEPGELPYGWKTALGKILTQFKSFAYKQTGFMANQAKRVGSEAIKGNFKPLLNALLVFGIGAPMAGEIVADAKALLFNKKRDTEGWERYFENILAATSFGLFDEIEALTGKYGAKGVVRTLFGPTVSDMVDVGETVTNIGAESKYDRRKAHRNLLRKIPLAGTTLSNTLVPNSYVDNFWGRNEGLSESDLQTYKDIQAVDPVAAETFKKAQQAERDQRNESDGFLKNLFGGGEEKLDLSQKPTTRKEAKEYKERVVEMLESGAVPDKETLNEALFSGKKATSDTFEDRKDVYSTLYNTLHDEEFPMPAEVEDAVIEAAGATREDYEFYKLSKMDQTSRLETLLPVLGDLQDPENFKELVLMRRRVGGQEVLSNGMINDLYRYDLISKGQRDFLKDLQYDEIKQEFYGTGAMGKDGSGGKKLSYSKLYELYKPIAPEFEKIDVTGGNTSKIMSLIAQMNDTNRSGGMQRTIDEILAGPKNLSQQSGESWFTPAT